MMPEGEDVSENKTTKEKTDDEIKNFVKRNHKEVKHTERTRPHSMIKKGFVFSLCKNSYELGPR